MKSALAACVVAGMLFAVHMRASSRPEGRNQRDDATRVQTAQAAVQTPVWRQRLQRWLQAVARHQPGSDDEDARAIGTWPGSDLVTLRGDLFALRDLLVGGWTDIAGTPESRAITYRGHDFRMMELEQLLGLTDDEARRGEANRLLWAGALLHSDIALLVPSDERPVAGRSIAMRFRDGQPDGYEYPGTAQWEFARDLVGAIRPDPSRDETVLTWYKATASYLLTTLTLSDAATQLDRGRQLFPADADLLFLTGCVNEAFSAPGLQNVARSVAPPPGHTIVLQSTQSYLAQAESHFTKALEKNARFTEARLRLGRVLGLLGRHQEAADQLRQAANTVGDSQVLYYACMFLGEEEQALGHRDAARDWYERAASLYPRAQSPLFALSNLASRVGDMAEAMRAADRIRGLPADENERVDPWRAYYAAGGRNAPTLWANLLAAVAPGGKR